MSLTERDLTHLRRCVELAEEALDAGDDPFGSVLVGADGGVLAEGRNRETTSGDPTAHPELELAQWAGVHLDGSARSRATVYTSGEHCPMCAAANAWVGIGRIVYAASSAQLLDWRRSWGLPDPPVRPLPVGEVAPGIEVAGPAEELTAPVRALHARRAGVGGDGRTQPP